MSDIVCDVCFHHCHLKEGQKGFCRARENREGKNVCCNYGLITSLALDPIEKKPLKKFYPGSYIVSVGSFGCNLACPFCQNASISMTDEVSARYTCISSDRMAEIVLNQENNLGIAFTYNEPLISYEYIMDVAERIKPYGKKVVLVTNGTVEQNVLEKLMPYVDAMNIDWKGPKDFYTELKGSEDVVKNTIAYVYDKCHLEVTTLVVPGKSDDVNFVEEEAEYLSSLDPSIVLHLSRYFPRYKYTEPATDPDVIYALQKTAQKYLSDVYTGNIW